MPELEVEIGGEAYPKEVREQQEAGRRVGTPEGHRGDQDSQPEDRQFGDPLRRRCFKQPPQPYYSGTLASSKALKSGLVQINCGGSP